MHAALPRHIRWQAAPALVFAVLLSQQWARVQSTCFASSRSSCSELNELSALDSEHTHGWTDQLGDTQVCGTSPRHAVTQCYKLPFLEAVATCKVFGARLCTIEELLANEVTGTGCGYDASNVWSSSRRGSGVSCLPGEILVSAGAGYNAAPTPLGLGDPQCAPIDGEYAVRCCGDVLPEPVACSSSALVCEELGWQKIQDSDKFCPQPASTSAYGCTDARACYDDLTRPCSAIERQQAVAANGLSNLSAEQCLCCADEALEEDPCVVPVVHAVGGGGTISYDGSRQAGQRCYWAFHSCPTGEGVTAVFTGVTAELGKEKLKLYGAANNLLTSPSAAASVLDRKFDRKKVIAEVTQSKARYFRRKAASDGVPQLLEPHGQAYTSMTFASDPAAAFTVRAGAPDVVLELQEAVSGEGEVRFTVDYSCEPIIQGCMDPVATNYDPAASVDDETCAYTTTTCTAAGNSGCNGYTCTATPFETNECACFRQAAGVGKRSRSDTWSTGSDGAIWAVGSDPFDVITDELATLPCESVPSASAAFRAAVNADATGGTYWLKFTSAMTALTDPLLPVGATFVVEGLLPAGYDLAAPSYQSLPVWNGAMLTCNHYARCLYRRLTIKNKWSGSNAAVAKAFNGGTMVFHDVLMQDNMAFAFHGAVWCHTGTICDFARVAVIGNVAHENAGVGGWGAISLRNSTVRDNWALRAAGVVLNRAREDRPCSDAKTDCSASGLNICNAGQCEPIFMMEYTEMIGNTAFGDFGGALAAGGSGLDVTVSVKHSVFDGNAAAVGGDTFYISAFNDREESRSFEVSDCTVDYVSSAGTVAYLREQANWKFHDLNIHNWQQHMLYSEGDGVGGCAAFVGGAPACSTGQECIDRAASTWCEPCPNPTMISDGMVCVECDRTQIPSDDLSECIACPAGKHSTGAACTLCEPGRFSPGGVSECIFCPGGSEPDVGTMLLANTSEGAAGCRQCDAGSYSAFGISCEMCNKPSIIPPGRSSCLRCGLGQGSTADRTACVQCEGNVWSRDGACLACPAGTAANSLKTQCTDYAEIDGSITEFSVIENIMNESRMVLSRRQSDGTIAKNVVVKAKVPVPSDALATLQDVALADLTDFLELPAGVVSLTVVSEGSLDQNTTGGTGRRRRQQMMPATGTAVRVELSILDPALEPAAIAAFDMLASCIRDANAPGCTCANRTECATGEAWRLSAALANSGLQQLLATTPTYSITCPLGSFRARLDPLCKLCPYDSIPQKDFTGEYRACAKCPVGEVASQVEDEVRECVCSGGTFSIAKDAYAFCFERDYFHDALLSLEEYRVYGTMKELGQRCSVCPPCMDCESIPGSIRLLEDYGFVATADEATVVAIDRDGHDRRAPSADYNAFKCPFEGACLAEPCENLTISTVWDLGDGQGSICAPGYRGLLCGSCDEGYARTSTGCTDCQGTKDRYVLLAGVVFIVLLLRAIMQRIFSSRGEAYVQLMMETRRSIQAVSKMLVTMMQILGSITFVMVFSFKDPFGQWISFFGTFTVDIAMVLELNCYLGNSFYTKFFVALATPLLIVSSFILYGVYKARRWHLPNVDDLTPAQRTELRHEFESISRRANENHNDDGTISANDLLLTCIDLKIDLDEEAIQQAIDAVDLDGDKSEGKMTLNFEEFLIVLHDDSGAGDGHSLAMVMESFERRRHVQGTNALVGIMIFLMYPGICQLSFAALRCRSLPGDSFVLEADYAIDCNSDTYASFYLFALAETILIPIGVPVGAFLLMHKHKTAILAEDEDVLHQFDGLIGDFKPTYYYWEVIELLRKLLLAGFIMFFAPGTAVQIIAGLFTTFMFFAAHSRAWPYKKDLHNKVKSISELLVFLVLLVVLLEKPKLKSEWLQSINVGLSGFTTVAIFLMGVMTIIVARETAAPHLAEIRGAKMAKKQAKSKKKQQANKRDTNKFENPVAVLAQTEPEQSVYEELPAGVLIADLLRDKRVQAVLRELAPVTAMESRFESE